ncbi:protein HAPLESS 2 isoform X2 [Salvia hispanica]|uniref:protein HAPLESS 2 isoform X2 n=1 Tax=Salvia hispanica TaxID=49212 RepID=UPI002009035D|nr:protein HAPLESS 2 isoform X2 [Salvia hispanica]
MLLVEEKRKKAVIRPPKTVFSPFHIFFPLFQPTTEHLRKLIQSMKTLILCSIALFSLSGDILALQILSKSKLEKCEKVSHSDDPLNCTSKIILDLAVPSESSGKEASMVAEIVEAEDNSTNYMRTLRVPPVITIQKSAAYVLYELTYIRDVAYKPQEFYVKTRKCERDAGANVVQMCERLRDGDGHIIEYTQPTCCPCGDQRRVPSSCGNFFDKLVKGKANTAHCLRFTDDWFHVYGIAQHSVGFSIRIEVKTDSKISEVIVGPKNRTAISDDKFLRVNLVGDFVGYTDIPSFEDFFLVIPREADQNRINRNQVPLYCVQGRFERINQHPGGGGHAFSIGITEVLNSNLLIELRADDIEYVYQRSPGKILDITVPTFEALTQFGTARIKTKNIGEVEASYSLTFDCSSGVSQMEEQFYIMKPKEVVTRSFKLYPTTDQAARYACSAILKDSDFSEVDRAECQFTTTATILDNGSQTPFQPPTTSVNGFFESIEELWNKFWILLADFITGKNCRKKCSGFFDFSCHIQYICISWMLLFGLFLAIFPTAIVLVWLLHEKGLFDPIYDWWEDHFWNSEERDQHPRKHYRDDLIHRHDRKHQHHKRDAQRKRNSRVDHRNRSRTEESYYPQHVHKDKHRRASILEEEDRVRHHHRRKGKIPPRYDSR